MIKYKVSKIYNEKENYICSQILVSLIRNYFDKEIHLDCFPNRKLRAPTLSKEQSSTSPHRTFINLLRKIMWDRQSAVTLHLTVEDAEFTFANISATHIRAYVYFCLLFVCMNSRNVQLIDERYEEMIIKLTSVVRALGIQSI